MRCFSTSLLAHRPGPVDPRVARGLVPAMSRPTMLPPETLVPMEVLFALRPAPGTQDVEEAIRAQDRKTVRVPARQERAA